MENRRRGGEEKTQTEGKKEFLIKIEVILNKDMHKFNKILTSSMDELVKVCVVCVSLLFTFRARSLSLSFALIKRIIYANT